MIWQAKNSVMTSMKLGIILCDMAHIVSALSELMTLDMAQDIHGILRTEMVIKKSINLNKELYYKAQYQK